MKNIQNFGQKSFILIVFFCIFIFIFWTINFNIDELARARGQIITEARNQVIQASQDGVVAEIFVKEGQSVKRGDILVRMDQSRFRAIVDDSSNKVASLRAALARLRAEVYGGPLSFPDELSDNSSLKKNQTRLFKARQTSLNQAISAIEASRQLVLREIRMTEPLVAQGDLGQAEVLRLHRQNADLEGQIANLRNKFFQDVQAEMVKAEEDLAAQEQLLEERSVSLRQTELRSNVDGLVKKITVTTIGASVRNGEVVLEVLPGDSELIFEAKFQPSDVGALTVGLPARIKLDSFDDSVYGALNGKLTYISPDALSEPDGRGGEKNFYRVRFQLDDPSRIEDQSNSRKITIFPGMTATVEVRTKSRSVFSYLTKPIVKTIRESLGER